MEVAAVGDLAAALGVERRGVQHDHAGLALGQLLHRRAFPSFFLSELGPAFLREFYRGFLAEGAVAVTAHDDSGRLVGVVVGHVNPSGFFRRLLVKRWYAFAFASLSLVVRRPSVVPRLPKTIDLTVDYLRSGLPRDSFARARVVRSGRRYASVQVEAWQDNRARPHAQATGHFLMPARNA